MKTGFLDKNGNEILEGDVVRYTGLVRTGTRVSYRGRGKRNEHFAIEEKMEIVGIVRFGMFKHYFDNMKTFFIETDQDTTYPSYFYTIKNSDAPRQIIKNLSTILTDRLAAECEVVQVAENESEKK